MDTKKLILLLIFFLGFFLRFFRLGDVPVGFHRDEAFLGYNAYSILKTGKDINGNFLPLHLESFIYSPAGYGYLSIPSIYIFGLSPFSVRLPSALFGSLTVLVIFYLVIKLFKEDKYYVLAILSSFFLAISPWHINLSRTSTENTIAVFFIALGTVLFLSWINNKRNIFLFLSFLSFGLTLLIYQAPRAFLPFLIPILIVLFVAKGRRQNLAFLIFSFTIVVPLFPILGSSDLSSRIRSLNIFNHPQTKLVLEENIREDGVSGISSLNSRVFHNKLIGYSSLILENYFKHFSYSFLFTDNHYPERFKISGMGLLYIFELPLILLGILYLLKTRKKVAVFFLGWMLVAPVGSSLTFDDVPNLQRTLLVFPTFSIFSAAGVYFLFNTVKNTRFQNFVLLGLSIFITYNFIFYLHQYYVHGIKHRPWFRNEGYQELVTKINRYLPSYKNAIITDRESGPTIFFLFFSKYDPSKFQDETKGKFDTKSDSVNFSKYEFTDKECPLRTLREGEKTDEKLYDASNTGERGILYVNHGNCELPKIPVNELSTIRRGDNSVVFRIFEVR